tara:strand:+ start:2814 stop:3671 length:858 start_codon:yes stop_codon:yes gene_type:complete
VKTFKGYVKEELQFGSSTSEIIFSDIADVGDLQIPMSSTMFKRIFPDTIRTTVFHVTGADLLDDLKKLEGKKKSISAFFKMLAHTLESGVVGGGGVVVEMDADIIVSGDIDVNTSVDKTGRRWAPMGFIVRSQLRTPKIKSVFKDLEKMLRKIIKTHSAYPNQIDSNTIVAWKELDDERRNYPKIMSLIIRDYYDGVEKVFKKHKTIIGKALYDYAKNNKLTDDAWDEQVVNNIKIKKVHILPDELMMVDQLDDAINFVEKNKIEYKKWSSSLSLEKYIRGITRK